MTTGTEKIAILNRGQKIRTLKGQTKGSRKGGKDPRAFKNALQPGVMNFIPVAYWNIYKRQKIVQAWVDEEILIVGNGAEAAHKKATAKKAKPHDAKASEEAATLAQLNAEESTDEEQTE